MDSNSKASSDIILTGRINYPSWILRLESVAQKKNIWHLVEPRSGPPTPLIQTGVPAPESSTIWDDEPQPPSLDALMFAKDQELVRQALENNGDTPNSPNRISHMNDPPRVTEPEEVEKLYNLRLKEFNVKHSIWKVKLEQYNFVQSWIEKSLKPDILVTLDAKLKAKGRYTIQDMTTYLKDEYAPSDTVTNNQIRSDYRATLEQARRGSVNPLKWHQGWYLAYQRAKAAELLEVEGTLATRDFLSALSSNLAPTWAKHQLETVVSLDELGLPTYSLDQYGKMFAGIAQELRNVKGYNGINATLGERSDGNSPSSNSPSGSSSGASAPKKKKCPCLPPKSKRFHPWATKECKILKHAITGSSDLEPEKYPDEELIKDIRKRFMEDQWKGLRAELKDQGWSGYGLGGEKNKKGKGKKKQKKQDSDDDDESGGNLSCMILDPALLELPEGIYSTMDFSSHPFSASTLVDNCGAVHLVNNKELLEPGSYVPSSMDDFVEVGTSRLPISGRGTRIIHGINSGEPGSKPWNLTLHNVAVVEGFHVNIISEARLRSKGLWLCGLDCTLRKGTMEKSKIVAKLTRKANVTFLEYKTPSNCLPVPITTLMYPTLTRRLRANRPSSDYLKPRSDSAALWHLRAGHLGPEALQKLVYHARNVKIIGIPQIKCEHCARANAKQVISRRTSENKSPRPFWRCLWDLFDFPTAYNGGEWLLVIKDEYSGKLFATVLMGKSHGDVFPVLRNFEAWVKRQYGLSLCVFRHDNERAVIPVKGTTLYQRWCSEQGIDIELPPASTKEPVGGAERAGQEIVTRSIEMADGANLPSNLWPESTVAAAYLYNKSPNAHNQWRSPNEVLQAWFRGYFRHYDPQIITNLTKDLRPDWSGTYAYGCRAYPLEKDRAANHDKRGYKTRPRAHIGYLVGYIATNIYRIWVPALQEVIITRNVRFDEETFYQAEHEKQIEAPEAIVKRIAEQIQEEVELTSYSEMAIEGIELAEEDVEEPNTPENAGSGVGETSGESHDVRGNSENPPTSGRLLDVRDKADDAAPNMGLNTPEATPEPSGPRTSTRRRSLRGANSSLEQQLESSGQEHSTWATGNNEVNIPMATEEELAHYNEGVAPTTPLTTEEEGEPSTDVGASGDVLVTASESEENPEPEPSTVRRSRRQQNLPPEQHAEIRGVGIHVMFTEDEEKVAPSPSTNMDTTECPNHSEAALLGLMIDRNPMWAIPEHIEAFFGTFWPSLERTNTQENPYEDVHQTIAAALLKELVPPRSDLPRIHQSKLPKAPKRWRDLEGHEFAKFFKEDCKIELGNLESMKCWRIIPRADAKTKPLPLQWVFTYKVDSAGFLTRCKSRIVVRGDLQEESTIFSTYAATLAARSFRVSMAVAARFDLEIKQYDVVNAFINALRDKRSEPVAVQLPDGFRIDGMCAELDRALYGLRDSPALWYKAWTNVLKDLKLVPCKEDPCIFMDVCRKVFIVFYVDDVQVLYHKDDEGYAMKFVAGIEKSFKLKNFGDVEWFLGVRVLRDRKAKKLWLVHDTYIEKVANRFKLVDSKAPSTPLPFCELVKNKEQASKSFIKEYQEKVGSVLYTAIMIRPDVAYAAAQLSHFLTNPSQLHMDAIDQTIRYLFGTRFLGIQYGGVLGGEQLIVASDASFADDPETRRSSHGYIFSLFGGLIAWRAARQATVTTSTTEAELNGVSMTAKELMALQRFFHEIRLVLGELYTVYCDNQQTIRLIVGENDRISTKLRHVDIQNMWLRQEHSKGTFQVLYMPTNEMPADGMTKNLPRQKFEHFRALLNMKDVRGMVEKLS